MLHTSSCAFGVPKKGVKVVWEVTNNCNENCRHCCNSHRRNSEDVSLEKAKRIADVLKAHQVERIVFSGGEPLLYTDIFDLARYCKTKGMDICFSTNGTLILKYLDELKGVQPRKMIISLDGFSPNSHDIFRGVENGFFQTIRIIEKASPYLNLEVHTVINRLNVGELSQLASYCNEHGITITFSNLVNTGNQQNIREYILTDAEYNFYISQVNHDFEGVHIVRHKRGILDECPAGEKVIGITTAGKFTPCLWISNFTDAFDVETYDAIQSITDISNTLFPFCNNCGIEECGKGCPAVALSQTNKIDPLCIKNYTLLPDALNGACNG